MADGYNTYRAARTAELLDDFRNLQRFLVAIDARAPTDDYYLEGFTVLRDCKVRGQAILNHSLNYGHPKSQGPGREEREKAEHVMNINDAFVRRFQCQRLYYRALAAQRWLVSRTTILGGGKPNAGNIQQLQAVDMQLRAEIAACTDDKVWNDYYSQEYHAGKWLHDDPPLSTVQAYLGQL